MDLSECMGCRETLPIPVSDGDEALRYITSAWTATPQPCHHHRTFWNRSCAPPHVWIYLPLCTCTSRRRASVSASAHPALPFPSAGHGLRATATNWRHCGAAPLTSGLSGETVALTLPHLLLPHTHTQHPTMGKSSSKTSARVLPLIPLAAPLAALPGTTLRIPIANRSDIAAILAKIYSISPTAKPDAAITVACVPLNSPDVSPRDGKLLLEDGASKGRREKLYESDPVNATKKDVFGYACVAKVSGVHGRRQGELSLVVEGLERVRVVDVVQDRPYFEGELEAVDEFGEYRLSSEAMKTNRR